MRRWLAAGDPALAPSSDLGDVVALLAGYDVSPAERGPIQAAFREQMLAFAGDHPDALLRSCVEGHFTGSAFVVGRPGVLLLFHAKLQRWLQPGGHADGDANLAGVALREAIEETGIDGLVIDPDPVDLDIHEIPAGKDPAHLHLDVRFVVRAPPGSVAVGNHESEDLRWVRRGELDAYDLDLGLRRLAAEALARAHEGDEGDDR